MATLSKKNNGWLIQFVDKFKRRRPIYLGKKFSERTARELRDVVETLVYLVGNGETKCDKRTLNWLQEAHPEIREKLAAVGLIEDAKNHTAQELWSKFIKTKNDIKSSTLETYDHAERRFFSFFAKDEILTELSTERMKNWKAFLLESLSEATVAGTITKAKAVFNWAEEQKWIDSSPLDGVGRGSFVNKAKDRFVTIQEYERLLAVCPCQDWQTIITLVRIGGLRAPSEVLAFRWSHIVWAKNVFWATSCKTERYPGKDGRWVPLFPELRRVLMRHFESVSPEHDAFVITRYTDPEQTNLGTQFGRIVKAAGLKPIPRPFDNMRASRSMEIHQAPWGGSFLESKWIGHSRKIAIDHYLVVRDEDVNQAAFDEAASQETPSKEVSAPEGLQIFPKGLHDADKEVA